MYIVFYIYNIRAIKKKKYWVAEGALRYRKSLLEKHQQRGAAKKW